MNALGAINNNVLIILFLIEKSIHGQEEMNYIKTFFY